MLLSRCWSADSSKKSSGQSSAKSSGGTSDPLLPEHTRARGLSALLTNFFTKTELTTIFETYVQQSGLAVGGWRRVACHSCLTDASMVD